jgi:hypothetical protein
VEATRHAIVQKRIVERHEGHALMVRHQGANQYTLLVLRQTLVCVINGFVETKST